MGGANLDPKYEPSKDDLFEMYKRLAHIRACDEVFREAIKTGRMPTFYFPITGHEAIAVGLAQATQQSDYVVAMYRGFHHHLSNGISFAEALGENTGKATGISGGKGGQMHMCRPEHGMMMTTGIVAGGMSPAVGLALSSKLKNDGRVTTVSFGDGALQHGYFHESANMAAIWKLPMIFLCENNRYSETVPTNIAYNGKLTDRPGAYGIPAVTVDGYDPIALYRVFAEAADRARSGFGPTFVDAECFRYFGHFYGDPMLAVPKSELEAELKKDSFKTYTETLAAMDGFDREQLDAIKAEEDAAAQKDLEATLAAPPPDASLVYENVYSNPIGAHQ